VSLLVAPWPSAQHGLVLDVAWVFGTRPFFPVPTMHRLLTTRCDPLSRFGRGGSALGPSASSPSEIFSILCWTSSVLWGLGQDFQRDLPTRNNLHKIARLLVRRLQRRYQFQPWTVRSIYRDFRGLVKRGCIGIGFGCFFQSLDRCAGNRSFLADLDPSLAGGKGVGRA
jgi:hypothetical protein